MTIEPPKKNLYQCTVVRTTEKQFYVRATSPEVAQEDAENLADTFQPEEWTETDVETWVDPTPVGPLHEVRPTWSGGPEGRWEEDG
jgi:hypothetical protein